jgi:hypothetical protein
MHGLCICYFHLFFSSASYDISCSPVRVSDIKDGIPILCQSIFDALNLIHLPASQEFLKSVTSHEVYQVRKEKKDYKLKWQTDICMQYLFTRLGK